MDQAFGAQGRAHQARLDALRHGFPTERLWCPHCRTERQGTVDCSRLVVCVECGTPFPNIEGTAWDDLYAGPLDGGAVE